MTTKDEKETPWTSSIPWAGAKYLGLSRNGSYAAAARGDIPTMQVGRLKRALVRKLEKRLAGEEK